MANATNLFITFDLYGMHCWPDAPDECKDLRTVHEHRFGVRVKFPVSSEDREYEFILVQRQLCTSLNEIYSKELSLPFRKLYLQGSNSKNPTLCTYTRKTQFDFQSRSCETLSNEIGQRFLSLFPGIEWCEVAVDEDGTHGAITMITREEKSDVGETQK